jgi:hypothetical protein
MRARQRHLNPTAAGATAAFDARFGLTMANGAAVDTWSNRTGTNNATQSTSTLRPIYRATGGNANTPAVEFDGTDDRLTHAIGLTVAPNLVMAVAKRTGGANPSTIAAFMPPSTANFNSIYARWVTGDNWGFAPGSSGQSILNEYKICSAVPASTNTASSSTTMWTNGANETTVTGTRYGGDAQDRRALGNQTNATVEAPLVGSISQVIASPADISAALRRRLEKAAAYSFRIACS